MFVVKTVFHALANHACWVGRKQKEATGAPRQMQHRYVAGFVDGKA